MRGVGEHDEAALLHSFYSLNGAFQQRSALV